MAEIIKFDPKFRKKEHECSFCHTPESKVKKLFSNGSNKFVCDKCLAIMKLQLEERN